MPPMPRRETERERENETVAILAQEPGVHACLSGGGLTPSARGHYQIKQRPFQDRPRDTYLRQLLPVCLIFVSTP